MFGAGWSSVHGQTSLTMPLWSVEHTTTTTRALNGATFACPPCSLMLEMPHAGENHRRACFVGSLNSLFATRVDVHHRYRHNSTQFEQDAAWRDIGYCRSLPIQDRLGYRHRGGHRKLALCLRPSVPIPRCRLDTFRRRRDAVNSQLGIPGRRQLWTDPRPQCAPGSVHYTNRLADPIGPGAILSDLCDVQEESCVLRVVIECS